MRILLRRKIFQAYIPHAKGICRRVNIVPIENCMQNGLEMMVVVKLAEVKSVKSSGNVKLHM